MFGFSWPNGPVLNGTSVVLRLPTRADFAEWVALRQESRAHLQRYEPRWTEADLTKAGFAARARLAKKLADEGQSFQFLIFERRGAPMLGGVTLGNIRRGAAQSAQIGYWLGHDHQGRGHMSDAVATVLRFAFGTLRLHRVEAASIAGNNRSIALLVRCGFKPEGTARAYLEIDGRRLDHDLFACLATDVGFAPSMPLPHKPSMAPD
jgi:[ribosomal protein S5]-alanine N-acetyltransferase